MKQLELSQQQFWNSLKTQNTKPNCLSLLSNSSKLSKLDRFNIYRNTMQTAHTSALSECFKCCKKILGERYFNRIAYEYYYNNSADSQNLNLYGQHFPQFMENWIRDHNELKDYKYLSDLASLEYAYENAYYQKDDPLFDFAAFSKLNEKEQPHVKFKISHTLSLLKSVYPIFEIWEINKNSCSVNEVQSISNPQFLCVSRDKFQPTINIVDENTWWIISKIQHGNSLHGILTLNKDENVNAPLNTIIPALIQNKWICGFSLSDYLD